MITTHTRSMAIDLFIFDLAGTTVCDDGFVHRAFIATAEEIGLRPDDEWVRSRMGVHKQQVLAELLRINGRDTIAAHALAHRFEEHIELQLRRSPPRALPGAAESIAALEALGVRVAFNTGFSAATTRPLLEALDWADRLWVSSDQVERGRPAPDIVLETMRRAGVLDARRVGLAGDTPADLGAGSSAGCDLVIGVGHGTHTLEELRLCPHTHLLPTCDGIPEIVRGTL
jgi:phosphonatase-like hydrolase